MKLKHHLRCLGHLFARYSLALLLTGILYILPAYCRAQQTWSVQIEKGSLETAIAQVRKTTGAVIAYNKTDLASLQVPAATFTNLSIEQLLEKLVSGLPLTLQKNGTTWVLLKNIPGNPSKGKDTSPAKSGGKVTGKVIDEENGQPVADATIRIGNKGTTSTLDGSFSLSLPKGKYTAEVSIVGYGKKMVTDIDVTDNQTFELNLTLKRDKGNLSAVTVMASARKESVASLYTRQKNAAGITDGISAEQIARTPDKNMGESIKRISGLSTVDNKYVVARGLSERYNQAMLNGQALPSTELNRKQFSFDVIPANMVDNVTVTKSLTPDKSAEFGGALVEVNTKDIPAEDFLNVTAGVTINSLTAGNELLSFKREGDKGYFGSYATHRYLFGQKNWESLNAIRGYQYAHRDETILSNNWKPYYYKALPSQNYQVSFGKVLQTGHEKQNRLGILASASYRNTQSIQDIITTRNGFAEGGIYSALNGKQYGFTTSLGGMLGVGYTTAKHKISWQNIATRLLDEQITYGLGAFHETLRENTRGLIESVLQTTLLQSQLRGEHALGNKGIRLNWIGSYTQVKRIRPDNHLFIWRNPQDSTLPFNDFTVAEWTGNGNGAGSATAPAALRMFSEAQEKNYSWDVNVSVPFKIGSISNSFKAGYAGWVKDRRFYVAMIGDHPGNLDAYTPLSAFFTSQYDGGRSSVSEFGDDYHRKAPLHAVYGMFDNRIGKLRLVWGLRGEYFDMEKINQTQEKTIIVATNSTNLDDVSALHNLDKKWQLFPSANITYSITPKINVRAAYSQSIVRPDLRELAYFMEYDYELGGLYQAEFLRPTKFRNYDLRFEWYPGAGEVISASVFYKDVKFPMEIYKNVNTYNLQNNFKSNNKGIELEMRKSLSFVHVPVIKNLTVYGNLTALTSRVTPMSVYIGGGDPVNPNKLLYRLQPGPEEKRPMMGQSNFIANAGLYYDDKHLHVSLSYNTVSNRLVIYNTNILTWQFEKPMRLLDGQIAYRFYHQRAEIKFNISNLLNESTLIYTNNGTPEENAEAVKGNYSQKFLLYNKNTDLIVQKLSPGRTWGVSISYRFK